MGSIAGLIILSASSRQPIISTPFRPPSRQYVYTHTFLSALDAASDSSSISRGPASPTAQLDPVLWVDETAGVCCWLQKGGLWFLICIDKEDNPLIGFRFLEVFLSILEGYIGDISESHLKSCFDIVYQLLEEMLDEGYPQTTEANILRDLVLPPSLLSKVLDVAGVSGLGPPSTHVPFSSSIPWRRSDVKHSSNEIFFDFVESVQSTVDRRGNTKRMTRSGRVDCNARLSGTPDLILTLTNPSAVSTPAFHPCVRLARYLKDQALSFVPPDGMFKLMDYIISRPSHPSDSSAVGNRGEDNETGVRFVTKVKLSERGGTFSLTVLPTHLSRPIEGAVVKWFLGHDVALEKVSATLSPGGSNEAEVGRWEVDGIEKTLIWKLPTLNPRSTARNLSGSFVTSSTEPLPDPTIHLSYTIHQASISQVRIAQLKVSNLGGPGGKGGQQQPKVFRGVRGRVEALVEARW
ncbi:Clathrin-associated protein medium chain [Phaffia rhodozyma]|uniref:Clathrin-associated protein medium chain n=1 Tax=Phaffia rhodozyma TaxID=264483 RepID=A0A0F7SXE6_PHARH|nr:Clathrin-associated protein medium chain [Phaffia rhodozyma]